MVVAGGKEFSPALLEELNQLAATRSRRQLAQHLCQRWAWQGPSGSPALMSARKALSHLHRLGHLPAPLHPCPAAHHREEPPWPAPATPLPAGLAELGPVRLVPLKSRRSREARAWKQIMAHHERGAGPLCGHQLRYLIECPHGYLGALAFGAAALQLRQRDQFIGWSEACRRHHLHRVVNNTRFLLLPWVRVPQLASHVLGLAARVLPADWHQRSGVHPLLLESFVDSQRFQGTCYAAAGWERVGTTTGRGRQDQHHQAGGSPKAIWIKPLRENWRAELLAPPRLRLSPPRRRARRVPPLPPPAQHWAEEELRAAELGDRRLTRRLIELVRDFQARPQAPIPEACCTPARIKAAYRFLDHPRVNLPDLLAPHVEQTYQRMASQPVVLAVQDTTELDYTAHPQTQGLGPIGNHRPGVHGLELHPTVAFSPQGVPLGVLEVQCWKRDPTHVKRFRRPIEQKEAVKWLKGLAAAQAAQARCPQSCVVSVGDCEADLYELYRQAQGSQTQFLVRAYRPRQRQEDGQEGWAQLAAQPAQGTLQVQLPRRGQNQARTAELSLRYAALEVAPPKYLRGAPAVRLWALRLDEINPPAGIEPVEWLLWTNLPVESVAAAVEKTRWYGLRFQIEVYFRTLKSGCRIEDRQLATAPRLENALALDLLVAWRVMYLTHQARSVPDTSAEPYFEVLEWPVLQALVSPAGLLPGARPLSLREAVRRIAQLGGFIGRKGDGEPGAQTLWRGLQHLHDMALGFDLAQRRAQGPVSSNLDYG